MVRSDIFLPNGVTAVSAMAVVAPHAGLCAHRSETRGGHWTRRRPPRRTATASPRWWLEGKRPTATARIARFGPSPPSLASTSPPSSAVAAPWWGRPSRSSRGPAPPRRARARRCRRSRPRRRLGSRPCRPRFPPDPSARASKTPRRRQGSTCLMSSMTVDRTLSSVSSASTIRASCASTWPASASLTKSSSWGRSSSRSTSRPIRLPRHGVPHRAQQVPFSPATTTSVRTTSERGPECLPAGVALDGADGQDHGDF